MAEGKLDKLIIVGAGGFGREVAWLVERINEKKTTWNLLGFIDDNPLVQNCVLNGYGVLGTTDSISEYIDSYFVCAVGNSVTRKKIIDRLTAINPEIKFATLLDPTVEISKYASIGEGSIVCAHSIITVNIEVGKHSIVNLDCTIGHDAVLKDYVTLYPSVNVSGATLIDECTEIGTGTQIIQGKTIGHHTIVGAGAVVVRDIPNNCTAVGTPAKPIKYFE